MTYENVAISHKGDGVAFLGMSREEKRNALNGALIDDLLHALDVLTNDPTVRVIVLHTRKGYFCVGGDLNWIHGLIEASRAERLDGARKLTSLFAALNACPKPVIGWVQGYAVGGGVGLMACCDIVMVEENTRLRLAETHLGFVPAAITPYIMAKIGEGGLRRLAIAGAWFDPDYAVLIGLAAQVHPKMEMKRKIGYEASEAMNAAPLAAAGMKAYIAEFAPRWPVDVAEDTAVRMADQWETDEAKAGVAAFLADRKPPWAPE